MFGSVSVSVAVGGVVNKISCSLHIVEKFISEQLALVHGTSITSKVTGVNAVLLKNKSKLAIVVLVLAGKELHETVISIAVISV